MYDNVEFVICCAGICTRSYPHAAAIAHKALLPMGDMRLIDYVLQDIVKAGGRHISIVCSNQKVIDDFKHALFPDPNVVKKLRAKGKTDIADITEKTFLPKDLDLKFFIQKEALGTAHVIYVARKGIQNRHVVLIFPDDILLSKDPEKPLMGRLVDTFLKNPKIAMLTGMYCDDVSSYAIIENNRVVEKPTHPTNHLAGLDPNILPREMIAFLIKQAPKRLKQARETGKEWIYIDALNEFLDKGGEQQGFSVKIFEKDPQDELIDTGSLFLYEQAFLRMLLTHSHFKKDHQKLVQKLLR